MTFDSTMINYLSDRLHSFFSSQFNWQFSRCFHATGSQLCSLCPLCIASLPPRIYCVPKQHCETMFFFCFFFSLLFLDSILLWYGFTQKLQTAVCQDMQSCGQFNYIPFPFSITAPWGSDRLHQKSCCCALKKSFFFNHTLNGIL